MEKFKELHASFYLNLTGIGVSSILRYYNTSMESLFPVHWLSITTIIVVMHSVALGPVQSVWFTCHATMHNNVLHYCASVNIVNRLNKSPGWQCSENIRHVHVQWRNICAALLHSCSRAQLWKQHLWMLRTIVCKCWFLCINTVGQMMYAQFVRCPFNGHDWTRFFIASGQRHQSSTWNLVPLLLPRGPLPRWRHVFSNQDHNWIVIVIHSCLLCSAECFHFPFSHIYCGRQ